MALSTTEELIAEVRGGRMVILMDDEARENEGDFLMAASCVRPENINFMARYGRGLICLTLSRERCERLNLPLMVRDTYYRHGTNFTVSIEAAEGVTTGISAADRALTIQKAVAPETAPSDLTQPGHVFPLMAQPGGVLTRAGHTEAGCDLARLAGFEPAGVIVEILHEDGSMARRPELERLADEHGLKIGTISDLIRFRIQTEKTVECTARCAVHTEFGEFQLVAYKDTIDGQFHMALVKGTVDSDHPMLVRVHVHNPICDLTGAEQGGCGWPLRAALQRVAEEGRGVVVILYYQLQADDLTAQVESYAKGTQESQWTKHESKDLRTIGLGSQILADIGVKKMRVLSTPRRIHSLSGFGLEVVEYVS